jgi:hypothetical protein
MGTIPGPVVAAGELISDAIDLERISAARTTAKNRTMSSRVE